MASRGAVDDNAPTANAGGVVKAAEDNPQNCADLVSDLSVLASSRAPLLVADNGDGVVDVSPGDELLERQEEQDEERGVDGAGAYEGMRQTLLPATA